MLRGYGLDAEHQTHATRLIGSLVHGFTSLELGGGFDHSTPDATSTWTVLLDTLHASLSAWTPGPPGMIDTPLTTDLARGVAELKPTAPPPCSARAHRSATRLRVT